MNEIYAQVLLVHPEGWTADGQLFALPAGLEWQPVVWLDPWDCEHQETMCAMCVDAWNQDYEIVLLDGIEA